MNGLETATTTASLSAYALISLPPSRTTFPASVQTKASHAISICKLSYLICFCRLTLSFFSDYNCNGDQGSFTLTYPGVQALGYGNDALSSMICYYD